MKGPDKYDEVEVRKIVNKYYSGSLKDKLLLILDNYYYDDDKGRWMKK